MGKSDVALRCIASGLFIFAPLLGAVAIKSKPLALQHGCAQMHNQTKYCLQASLYQLLHRAVSCFSGQYLPL